MKWRKWRVKKKLLTLMHSCVFFGALSLSEWHQHQKPSLKAIIKRRLTLYGAVIKGRQFSKKLNIAKMK